MGSIAVVFVSWTPEAATAPAVRRSPEDGWPQPPPPPIQTSITQTPTRPRIMATLPQYFYCLTAVLYFSFIWIATIFLDITPCSPLKINRGFGETYRLHLRGRRISRERNQRESRWQAELLAWLILRLWRWRLICTSETSVDSQRTTWH
jgi:hypothetical protein